MTIPFKNIPSQLRVPLFYAELDNSRGNSGQNLQATLILGQMLPTGTATPGVPVLCRGKEDAKLLAGSGSQAALMVATYRKNDGFGPLYLLPLADPTGNAAVGTVTVTSQPTGNGQISLYIGGHPVQQPVVSGMTQSAIAAALIATINAITDLPVTAAIAPPAANQQAATNVVTLTARHVGALGNEIDLRLNYRGAASGEVLPPGLTLALAPMAGGTGVPVLPPAFANLLDQPFDFIVNPFTDPASLDAVKGLLDDIAGRWSWARQVYGHGFSAARGTVGGLTTLGAARNDQHHSILGFYDSPTPAWRWAAAFAGAAAVSLRADPALPLQTLPLVGVLAPPFTSRFAITDRNVLLYSGISTFTTGDDGTVAIENAITTYQKNGFGQPDDSYLEVETLFTLAYVLRFLAGRVTSKYGRVKLAADGINLPPGSGVVTPGIIRSDVISAYLELEDAGLVQQGEVFKRDLVVEKSQTNPNRVDVLYPAILINQLRIFALLAQFRLQ